MNTTLNLIRSHRPSDKFWEKLLRHLGKTEPDDEPLSLRVIIESNGLDYALWCLRAVPNCDKEARLYAVWCARQVQHLITDPRFLAAPDVAERYADGKATDEELAAAWGAAWAATSAADEYAASEAAWHVAKAAASAAAWDVAWAAASAAALNAAWAAASAAAWGMAESVAWAAAWAAAWASARQEQEKKFVEMFCQEEVTT